MARANQVPGASLPLRQHLHRRVYACASAWSEGVDYHVPFGTIAAFSGLRLSLVSSPSVQLRVGWLCLPLPLII